MIQVTFQFETLQDLSDFTAAMVDPVPRVTHPIAAAALAPAEELRPTKVRKTTKAAGPDTGGVPASELVEAPAVKDGRPIDEADVRAAITAVNDKFGLVPARKVLTQFGVKRIPELKPEQYADFVKACNAVK